MLDERRKGKRFGRYIPIIGWDRSSQRAWLRDDLINTLNFPGTMDAAVCVGSVHRPAVDPDSDRAPVGRTRRGASACLRRTSRQ
jgi:hypothetical protein